MAIYHISSQLLTRSKGHSAIGAAAYRRAAILKDERTGIIHDYSKKQGVIYGEMVMPDNSPDWALNIKALQKEDATKAAEILWNSIEKAELRKDAQVAREINVALPLELSQNQCIALMQEYVKRAYCDEGMVADFTLHWESNNPHAHIMLSTRSLTVEGWGKKERRWNDKSFILKCRALFSEVTNRHLALAGFDIRVSHLSYIERGIDLEPTIHEGSSKKRSNEQAKIRNKAVRLRNLQKIADNPEIILDKLSSQHSDFSAIEVTKSLKTYITPANDPEIRIDPGPPKHQAFHSKVSRFLKTMVAPRFFEEPASLALEIVPNNNFNAASKENPETLLNRVFEEITLHDSVFNEKILISALVRHVANPELLADALIQIKASPQLMAIGFGEDGRERYTTREMFELENDLQDLAEELGRKSSHCVKGKMIKQCIKELKLGDDQAKAIRHILKGNDISIMVGRAGTGKSYSLQAARKAWEASGYRVYGIALAGIAADNLQKDSGIHSRTIESFCYALKEEKLNLTAKDIVVMDEAGMTDSFSMFKILKAVVESGSKLVLVGDAEQLQPVGPGAIFRAFVEQLGFAELTTIWRQREVWQKEATLNFAKGNTEKGLEYYQKHGCLHLCPSDSVLQDLINHWSFALQNTELKENLILAYQNKEVRELNELARAHLIEKDLLKSSHTTHTDKGQIEIAVGERLLFRENNWRYGLKNGQRATVIGIKEDNGKVLAIEVVLDGSNKKIQLDPSRYNKFGYGYAVTVHRAQGVTVDKTFVLASHGWNQHLSYVAMTRHRVAVQLYGNSKIHKTLDGLKKTMARQGTKDSVLDYPLAFGLRRGIEIEEHGKLQKHLFEKLKLMGKMIKNNFEETFFPNEYWSKKKNEAEKKQKIEETLARREDATKVAAYVDANRAVGRAYQALLERQRILGIHQSMPLKEREALLKNHPSLRIFREAINNRNELAALIYKEYGRYQIALQIYDISLEKLRVESKKHEARKRVLEYLNELKSGRMIHRDRLAYFIQNELNTHYSTLLTENVSLSELKTHANAHLRRVILKTLSSEKRHYFRKFEDYLKISECARHLWRHIKEKEKTLFSDGIVEGDLTPYQTARLEALTKTGTPLLREWIIKANKYNMERDKLASEIYQNLTYYKEALHFYEFGNTRTSIENNKFNLKAKELASERLERLTKEACHFIQKEDNLNTIQHYLNLLNANIDARFEIAAQIIADKKKYYHIIFETQKEPLAILRALHQDTKTHERNIFIKGLTKEERDAFEIVERYAKAKKTSASIWIEIKEEKSHPVLRDIINPYLILRDSLAVEIKKNPSFYDKALTYFKIKLEDLDKNVLFHQIRSDIKEFKTVVGDLEKRIALARKIVQNKSAYSIVKEDETIQWSTLKHYANYGIKIEKINTLSPQEKADYHLVLRYKRLRKEAGKSWAFLFQEKREGKTVLGEQFEKAIQVNVDRNQLAFVIYSNRDRFAEFLYALQVQTKDIEKHAKAHEKTLQYQKIEESFQKSKQTNSLVKKKEHYWDITVITQALEANSAHFVENILGAPNHKLSNATTLRYGKKGSLAVTIHGPKSGTWYDFESGEGGNLLSLLQREYGYGFKEALRISAEMLGIVPSKENFKTKKITTKKKFLNSFNEKELQMIAYAKKIVENSVSIAGTPAEQYLKIHRGITGHVLEESFRFNPSVKEPQTGNTYPALVIIARNNKQEVQAVQCIYLDPLTFNKAKVDIAKRTFGSLRNACVLVQRGDIKLNQFALAEGPETALSVAQSDARLSVFATLSVSNFGKSLIPIGCQNVILCADNDGEGAASNIALKNAIALLAERGLNVWCAKPTQHKDFNDVPMMQGSTAIKDILEKKELIQSALTLSELIEHPNTVSKTSKLLIEFIDKQQIYKSLEEPKTKLEAEEKIILFESLSQIATIINNDLLLKEAAARHQIGKEVSDTVRNYKEYQKWRDHYCDLIKQIKSRDPIKDYSKALLEKDKLTPSWETQSTKEKELWNKMNLKIKKLAYIIDKDPSLQFIAKQTGIYDKIKRSSSEYQLDISNRLSINEGIGIKK